MLPCPLSSFPSHPPPPPPVSIVKKGKNIKCSLSLSLSFVLVLFPSLRLTQQHKNAKNTQAKVIILCSKANEENTFILTTSGCPARWSAIAMGRFGNNPRQTGIGFWLRSWITRRSMQRYIWRPAQHTVCNNHAPFPLPPATFTPPPCREALLDWRTEVQSA